jgi:hypothetical protein
VENNISSLQNHLEHEGNRDDALWNKLDNNGDIASQQTSPEKSQNNCLSTKSSGI